MGYRFENKMLYVYSHSDVKESEQVASGYVAIFNSAVGYSVSVAGHSSGQPEVMQQTTYYPFGYTLEQSNYYSLWSEMNKNLYNGKELQDDELGGVRLDWYDYGARFYDPIVVHWTTPDPLSEKFYSISPYVYCKNNPIILSDPNGLYPKSILVYNASIGLYGGYHFTQSAATLLSLVSGVSKFYIENVIIQERAPGQYRPFYSSDVGGGAITLGTSGYRANITYTQNFFADDPLAYDNHGYGQNIHAWLALSSHEVGHIPQIDDAGGLLSYVGGMIKEYALSGHDDAPSEIKADEGYKNFIRFNRFVDKAYGAGALTNLFNSDARESKKSSTIEKWYGEYQDAQKAQKNQATQLFMINFQNQESGKYKWDGSNWLRQ